jgi:hypothetical protein
VAHPTEPTPSASHPESQPDPTAGSPADPTPAPATPAWSAGPIGFDAAGSTDAAQPAGERAEAAAVFGATGQGAAGQGAEGQGAAGQGAEGQGAVGQGAEGVVAGRKRRRWPVVVAVVVVLTLLLSGAAYGGMRAWYGWGITEPEQVLPADVVAFTRIDLAPGYREKLQLADLVKKFPAGQRKNGPSAAVDAAERRLFGGTGLDFEKDIKPWFADRVGFALWLRDGLPVPVLALAVDDDAKASRALAKARVGGRSVGFTLLDGYALVVREADGGQSAAKDVAAAARAHPLAKDTAYRRAVGRLRVNSVAFAYTDLSRLGAAARAMLTSAPDSQLYGGWGGTIGLDGLSGTIAAGASVVDDGVEVLVRGSGLPASPAGDAVDVRAKLGAAPAGSLIAVSTNGNQPTTDGRDNPLTGALTGVLFGTLGFGFLPGGTTPIDPGTFPFDPGTDPFDPGTVPFDPGTGTDPGDHPPTFTIDPKTGEITAADPKLQAQIQAQVKAQMEKFRREFEQRMKKVSEGVAAILSAKVLTLAVTALGAHPAGQLDVQPRDAAGATALTDLGALLGGQSGLSVSQAGDSVRVSLGDKETSGGTLRDSDDFRRALGSIPGTTDLAAYLDVRPLLAASGASDAQRAQWAPVHAIGMVVGRDGAELTAIVRIVIP